MRRSVGLAVGAVVLSITLGVLAGLLIHASMVQRVESSGATDGTRSAQTGTGSMTQTLGRSSVPSDTAPTTGAITTPWSPGPAGDPVPADGAPNGAGPTAPADTSTGERGTSTTTARRTTPTTRTSPKTRRQKPRHPTGSATPSRSGPATTSAKSETSAATTATGTTATTATSTVSKSGHRPRPGKNSADRRCRTFGAKSADRTGTTLFCQHDQTDGSLRWRAVTNGGGCVNQQMVGTDKKGRRYDCTLGDDGLNHWVPVH